MARLTNPLLDLSRSRTYVGRQEDFGLAITGGGHRDSTSLPGVRAAGAERAPARVRARPARVLASAHGPAGHHPMCACVSQRARARRMCACAHRHFRDEVGSRAYG